MIISPAAGETVVIYCIFFLKLLKMVYQPIFGQGVRDIQAMAVSQRGGDIFQEILKIGGAEAFQHLSEIIFRIGNVIH